METVLITGSNGFIGRAIAEALHGKYRVLGCGSSSSPLSKCDGYIQWNLGRDDPPDCLFREAPEYIVHAAACKDTRNDSEALFYTNCLGTYQIYRLCREIPVQKIVLISGITVIGRPPAFPITESLPLAPGNMYLASKATQELILSQLSQSETAYVGLRVPSPVGPGQPIKTILPVFLYHALRGEDLVLSGSGSRRQNYVDVRDIAQAVLTLLNCPDAHGLFNIGADSTISNLELAEKCVQLCGSQSRIVFSGLPDPFDSDVWEIDSSHLAEETGFLFRYSIEDSIRDMISVMRSL
ncbi:MAG: NAD(P)-dependent oxidoreductase [Oscillospiraceae bacterium]|nr:NAD(P)-dependent oxidoreductase [Oscillospiraceae bacterium]